MRKWLRNCIGGAEELPQAHMLFVDGENTPPAPDLMMDAVLSHAGCELDIALAWAKWYPTMLLLRGLREVGVECIQADEGSNNADIMLSMRAMKEVNKRAGLGQGGIAYVAFGTDKGFSHLLRGIKTTKGWKSVYVTSFEDPPSILVRSASEVLYVHKSPPPKKTPPAKKQVKPPPPKKGRRRPKKEAKPKTPDWSELDTSNKDDLEKLLISLIGRDNLNGAVLGHRISAYQKNNGLQDTGSKALLKEFGFDADRNLSLNKVITQEFSEKISAEATSFRTDPETGKKIISSFEYSVKRTTRPDSLSNDVDQVKFINSIEELLSGDDEISVMVIGNRIRKMQEVNEWEELGTGSFLQHHGFSRNFGLLNALKLCFGNQIEIEGNINAQRIIYKFELREAESTELKGATFPLVRGLNHSKSTFSLPRHPHHLGAALIWITENAHLYPTFPEVREQLASETNISKTRGHKLLTNVGRAMGERDWLTTATTSNMDAIVIFDALQRYVNLACVAQQIEFTEQYSEYFSLARNHISGNTEEE